MLVPGVVHLDEPAAVFTGMVEGWCRQQRSRMLGDATITSRERLVRRFQAFAESYPWQWTPGDIEDFTVSLTSGSDRLAVSTIRGYHLALRMFCDYITDGRYEWAKQCRGWRPGFGVKASGRRFLRRADHSRRRTYTRGTTSIAQRAHP